MNDTSRLERERAIIRTSLLGIAANLLLVGFKTAVGLLSHSIAIVLDALNNLSDVLSSVVTIAGTKFARKKPDKKHPLGYGRIEFISAMAVAVIILYAGVAAGIESIKKLIHPEIPEYSSVTLIVVGAAVIVKLLLGSYVKRVGKQVDSGALTASGSDALFDAVISLSVLVSAVLFLLTGIQLEAAVGLIISAFIIKSGFEMLLDTLDDILGKRVGGDYLEEIRKTICSDAQVHGAYDLLLHSYGHARYFGSVHVEVDDILTAEEIDQLERRIAENVHKTHDVILTGISIYSRNTRSDAIRTMRADITRIVTEHEGVLEMHGFYADEAEKCCTFDVILDYGIADRQAIYDHILDEIRTLYPEYTIRIAMDIDVL